MSVAGFINRANYKLVTGNFKLDFELREFRYKISLDVSVAIPPFGLINNFVYTKTTTMDEFLRRSYLLPKYAIDQIEYMPDYTESYSLIDEGITVTDVIEKADKIQNYPQSSHVEEQQLSI